MIELNTRFALTYVYRKKFLSVTQRGLVYDSELVRIIGGGPSVI